MFHQSWKERKRRNMPGYSMEACTTNKKIKPLYARLPKHVKTRWIREPCFYVNLTLNINKKTRERHNLT